MNNRGRSEKEARESW